MFLKYYSVNYTDYYSDSITYGYQSTDGNGYRLELYNDLTGGYNNTVDLIGSVQAGTMADNYNEGHSGATIDEIASFASLSLFELPNVVLIHAGTNDMNLPLDPADAPTRLGNLIDTVLATVPDAVLLVAQIIPSGTQATEDNIVTFNAAIPGVVASRVAAGSKVLVVDMFTRLTYPDDFTDDLHPNDQGYQIMGDVWYEALGYADTVLNWITPPAAASSHNGDILCQQLPTWYPQGEVANGAGLGADAYPDILCLD
jgi:lysophospholipase L1-like esterase